MHFYQPDGTFIDGLRLARKTPGALVSPSSVLGIFTSYGLQIYLQDMMWQATATTPRLEGESDEAWKERCHHAADEHSKAARDKGTAFHDWAQEFHKFWLQFKGRVVPAQMPTMMGQCAAYEDWFKANVAEILAVEKFVVGDAYAGTLDLAVRLLNGQVAIVDTKTQGLKGKGTFGKYSRWSLQLGSYASAFEKTTAQQVDCLISVIVSSDEPVKLESYEWPKRVAHYSDLFQCALRLWKEDNNWEQ